MESKSLFKPNLFQYYTCNVLCLLTSSFFFALSERLLKQKLSFALLLSRWFFGRWILSPVLSTFSGVRWLASIKFYALCFSHGNKACILIGPINGVKNEYIEHKCCEKTMKRGRSVKRQHLTNSNGTLCCFEYFSRSLFAFECQFDM